MLKNHDKRNRFFTSRIPFLFWCFIIETTAFNKNRKCNRISICKQTQLNNFNRVLYATRIFSYFILVSLSNSFHCNLIAGVVFGQNLIVNGDAEAGTASPNGDDLVTIPGWSITGNLNVVAYGTTGGFPLISDPGPPARGGKFFAGGPSNAMSIASQLIDVSSISSSISKGSIEFNLSGYLGGFESQEDNARLTASFVNNNNSTLGVSVIGPVSAADRSYMTGLFLRESHGKIPSGTQFIRLELEMIRTNGSYNDGFADNLSLVLYSPPASVPEPTTLAIVALGATCMACRRRQH
jgi:hypothetical protein